MAQQGGIPSAAGSTSQAFFPWRNRFPRRSLKWLSSRMARCTWDLIAFLASLPGRKWPTRAIMALAQRNSCAGLGRRANHLGGKRVGICRSPIARAHEVRPRVCLLAVLGICGWDAPASGRLDSAHCYQ